MGKSLRGGVIIPILKERHHDLSLAYILPIHILSTQMPYPTYTHTHIQGQLQKKMPAFESGGDAQDFFYLLRRTWETLQSQNRILFDSLLPLLLTPHTPHTHTHTAQATLPHQRRDKCLPPLRRPASPTPRKKNMVSILKHLCVCCVCMSI